MIEYKSDDEIIIDSNNKDEVIGTVEAPPLILTPIHESQHYR